MIQIDMPMPKNCHNCIACNEYLMCVISCNGRDLGGNDVKDYSQGRHEWCPMKEQEAVEPITDSARNRRCPKCNTILKGKFCHECGQEVKWE